MMQHGFEGGKCEKCPILLVPGERIELPTNGLQNRCSTAELTRHINDLAFSGYELGTAFRSAYIHAIVTIARAQYVEAVHSRLYRACENVARRMGDVPWSHKVPDPVSAPSQALV
jgi:hypothetical protein